MAAKNYSLILNKNGRLDIISFPRKSNLQLAAQDIIIIEGDRGKDLVMVLKPVVEFRFALFFNYLKKKLHLKSLEFGNSGCSGNRKKDRGNNNKSSKKSRFIINEDENFITLPNKQILRFAKPQELLLRLKLLLWLVVAELLPKRNGGAGEKTDSLLIELTDECGEA